MSTIKAAIAQHLIAQGTTAGSRVYWMGEAPSSTTYPYVTMQRISNAHVRHHGGSSQLTEARFQFNAWGTTDAQAETLADEIRAGMDTLEHTTIGSGAYVTSVDGVFLENDLDDYVAPTDASERGRHRRILDFIIWHAESAPSPAV